jgi:hypothetical protein
MNRWAGIAAAAGLALAGAGCMGEPTREVLLPSRLKGAKVTADGREPVQIQHDIAVTIPLRSGVQVVRIEPAKGAPIVERSRLFVNEPGAERAGENVVIAKVDQGWFSRTTIAFPDDPISNLGHDFDPPADGEGVILLASEPTVAVAIDGAPRPEPLDGPKGLRYQSYKTRPAVVRLAAGKHRVEFRKPGFAPCAVEVEVVRGEYALLGATLAAPAKPVDAPAKEGGKT